MSTLAARLAAEAPLSVARYMALCSEHYYATRDPFGRSGDFITAPEVSQTFGELLGLWCVALWQQAGRPADLALVEVGPGRGTLMADALRAIAKTAPQWHRTLAVHLVETSPTLRAAQRSAIPHAQHHEDTATLPACPLIVLGNEFLDALPVHHLVYHQGNWRERLVTVTANGSWQWALAEAPSPLAAEISPAIAQAEEGSVVELGLAARAVTRQLAARLVQQGGAALLIDYGYATPALGETLQAVKRHATHPVLATPGEADLTAHVDFQAIALAAAEVGAEVTPVVEQGMFLRSLGIVERTEHLIASNPGAAGRLRSSLRRLIEPSQMGSLFKVIGFAHRDWMPLPGLSTP